MSSSNKESKVERMAQKKNGRGLIKMLKKEKDSGIRSSIVFYLGEIGDPAAVEPLMNLLRTENPGSRLQQRSVEALTKIGEPAVVPLIEALEDQSEGVRQVVATALGKFHDPRVVQPLIRALGDKHWPTRKGAATALGKIGDGSAVKPLLGALEDETEWVREAVVKALDQLGYQADGAPVAAAPDVRMLATKKDGHGLIKALAYERDPNVREAAANALGDLGDHAAIEPLIDLLNEPWSISGGPHDAGVRALTKIGSAAVEPLIAALKNAKRSSNPMMDPDQNLRIGCVRALGMIGDPRAIDALLKALSDNIPIVRSSSAQALEEIGDSAVLPLIELLERMGTRGPVAAADALNAITGKDFRDNARAWRQWWEKNQ